MELKLKGDETLCDVCERTAIDGGIETVCARCFTTMNKDTYCGYCEKVTKSDYWNCYECGLCKIHSIEELH